MPIGSRSCQYTAVSGTSAKFAAAMDLGQQYIFVANVDCWVALGATGGAAVANTEDNLLYIKGQQLPLMAQDGGTNSFVHVIQDSTAGDACLMVVEGA